MVLRAKRPDEIPQERVEIEKKKCLECWGPPRLSSQEEKDEPPENAVEKMQILFGGFPE